MFEFNEKIRRFGELFRGRMGNEILSYAIEYVDYNEPFLAFETICEHLCEYDVFITEQEYEIVIEIYDELEMSRDDITLAYLKKLVINPIH